MKLCTSIAGSASRIRGFDTLRKWGKDLVRQAVGPAKGSSSSSPPARLSGLRDALQRGVSQLSQTFRTASNEYMRHLMLGRMCVCVCVSVCVRARARVCFIRMHVCMHACMYVCAYAYEYECVIRMYVCMYIGTPGGVDSLLSPSPRSSLFSTQRMFGTRRRALGVPGETVCMCVCVCVCVCEY